VDVLVAENCGFCPGVKNAITLAARRSRPNRWSIASGPSSITKTWSANWQGWVCTRSNPSSRSLRQHGVDPVPRATKKELELIQHKGLKVVDATCVLVKRVQRIAQELTEDGYRVVMVGDADHPECGRGRLHGGVMVVRDTADLHKLFGSRKLGVICQTTQSPDYFARMVGEIIKSGFAELRVVNTLCRETMKRQQSRWTFARRWM